MLGVLWKFGPTAAVYANYVEGLVRGEVAPLTSGTLTVTNGGQALAPNKSKQTELGAKFDFGRIEAWIARHGGLSLVERRKITPLRAFTLVRIRKG